MCCALTEYNVTARTLNTAYATALIGFIRRTFYTVACVLVSPCVWRVFDFVTLGLIKKRKEKVILFERDVRRARRLHTMLHTCKMHVALAVRK